MRTRTPPEAVEKYPPDACFVIQCRLAALPIGLAHQRHRHTLGGPEVEVTMSPYLLSRREFSARCSATAVGALLAVQGGTRVVAAADAATQGAGRTVKLPDGAGVPAVGQGAWHMGQGRHPEAVEEEAVRTGPHDVGGDGIARACDASLARLGTDHLDLYLLHHSVATRKFSGVVAAFEQLRGAGKIRAWGVSNFDKGQMDDLFRVPDGQRCATNQVSYSLRNRRIERDLLPWCMQHSMPVMAYSPLGGDHHLVIGDATLAKIGAAHGCSAAAVALAWVIRSGNVIAIPESGSSGHTKENAVALSVTLTAEDVQTLDAAFPGPGS